MSFDEKISILTQRIPKLKEHLETEEATKNALVMPFISALGSSKPLRGSVYQASFL